MTVAPDVVMEIAALNQGAQFFDARAERDGHRWPRTCAAVLRRESERLAAVDAEAPELRFWPIGDTQWCVGADTLSWSGMGLRFAYNGIRAYQFRDPAPPLPGTSGQARMALARAADAVVDKSPKLAECIRAVRAHRGALVYRPPLNSPTLALNPSS